MPVCPRTCRYVSRLRCAAAAGRVTAATGSIGQRAATRGRGTAVHRVGRGWCVRRVAAIGCVRHARYPLVKKNDAQKPSCGCWLRYNYARTKAESSLSGMSQVRNGVLTARPKNTLPRSTGRFTGEGSTYFFEKKNQKTFANCHRSQARAPVTGSARTARKFLVLFSKRTFLPV